MSELARSCAGAAAVVILDQRSCALALSLVVIVVISAPLRAAGARGEAPESARPSSTGDTRRGATEPRSRRAGGGRVELEAAREAKYREIRDAELDYRTGKLSHEDYAATDGALRAEAVEILDRLTALQSDALRSP